MCPAVAAAQSAADKATARELAVAGIEEFRAGKYETALDKLQRAEALYDAHVHLLYIARCSVQLGRLVDGAEAYRALLRKPLPPDASPAVRAAKTDADKELSALEPRIPTIRIDVQPPNLEGLELTINDVPVSAAAVGVDRPANPGQTVVRAAAPGYENAEATINLAEGAKEHVSLTLEPGEGEPLVDVDTGSAAAGAGTGGSTSPPPPKPVSFVIEPRVLAAVPVGQIGGEPAGKVSRGGGGGELRFGVHFKRRFTGSVFAQVVGTAPGTAFDRFGFAAYDNPSTDVDESATITSGSTKTVGIAAGGLGFAVSTPHHQIGWFVGVDLLGEVMGGRTEINTRDGSCVAETSLTGGGARLNGGGVIPLAKFLQLTPFATFGMSSYMQLNVRGDCAQELKRSLDSVHGWLGVGVGGQILLGE